VVLPIGRCVGVARISEEDRKTIWDVRQAGAPVKRITKHLGGFRRLVGRIL